MLRPCPFPQAWSEHRVNNIPPKSCSYSCVYCQVGSTQGTECATRVFLSPDLIFEAVKRQLSLARQGGEPVDYVTFVADGEPTLDANLGEAIRRIKGLGAPVAVISNGSLVTLKSVRDALSRADWVSLKIDAVEEISGKESTFPTGPWILGIYWNTWRCSPGATGEPWPRKQCWWTASTTGKTMRPRWQSG